MKRLLTALLLCLLCLTLCSCEGAVGIKPPELDKPFSASAEIVFGKESCKAQIKRFSDNGWEFCVTEPFALEGLIVTIRGGETKLSMYGLESTADHRDDAVSAAKLIAQAMDAAKSAEITAAGDGAEAAGTSGGTRWRLSLSSTGVPCLLTLEDKGISVKFTEIKPLAEESAEEEKPFVSVD